MSTRGTMSRLGPYVLAGACALVAPAVSAAEIAPGGKLDVAIGGFARFLYGFGDLRERTGDRATGSHDAKNDTEVHVRVTGKDGATGLEYGATIELEADTNRTGNADETYVFLKGAFGELRLGDDDGVTKEQAYSAGSVAVATGGLDGTIVDDADLLYLDAADNDDTKIKYFSPRIAGFQIAVGFTPAVGSNGDEFPASTDAGEANDVVEAALRYNGAFAGVDVALSVGGLVGHLDRGTDDDVQGIQAGTRLKLAGASLGAGIGRDEMGSDERSFFNLGAAYDFGAVAVSVNYGQCFDCDREKTNLILGAEMGLLPGVSIGGEVSIFDRDRGGEDNGILGVATLRLAF